ncbi:HNH endonuclease [Haladaptatus sp. DFWS20]|uniref:HNH endonuclease n=1 Tax=Haladaptatus sp. DFWS20 TaxID=3403467 RepID=UPI003EB6EC4D
MTDEGQGFVEDAVEEWADTEWSAQATNTELLADTYETTTLARVVVPEFRATVIARHGRTCPVSGVDHPALLDVAHVLPWSEYPEYRADLANVLPLSKTHHAAFDRELFTIDREYRLRVNPSFETESELLQRTILDRAGERISVPDESLSPEYVAQHNATLGWV